MPGALDLVVVAKLLGVAGYAVAIGLSVSAFVAHFAHRPPVLGGHAGAGHAE